MREERRGRIYRALLEWQVEAEQSCGLVIDRVLAQRLLAHPAAEPERRRIVRAAGRRKPQNAARLRLLVVLRRAPQIGLGLAAWARRRMLSQA